MINKSIEFECIDLCLKLGNKSLFQHFNFKFSGPGIIFVEGENGTGKSSLLKVLAGFIIPEQGKIFFNVSTSEFSFFTTTSMGLLPDLTGIEHIQLVSKSLKLNESDIKKKIEEFQELHLFQEILEKKVADFSQGMKQILRLFLHLITDPKVLFLDEPFLYLSPALKEFIQKKIEVMSHRSLIFITDQKVSWSPDAKSEKIVLGAL